jgi:hypothetical protein
MGFELLRTLSGDGLEVVRVVGAGPVFFLLSRSCGKVSGSTPQKRFELR